MDWNIDHATMAALGGERLTITLNVAELVPGTYVCLDVDDEVIARGVILDVEDLARRVPLARPDFGDEFDDAEDTNPDGCTVMGPLMVPRAPGPVTARPEPARAATIKGRPIQPRYPAPMPDQILNEIDDDDVVSERTIMGALMKPRRPALKNR